MGCRLHWRRQVFKSGTAFNIEHRKWDVNSIGIKSIGIKSGTAINIEAKKWDGNCRPCPIGGDAYGCSTFKEMVIKKGVR